jgi:8-amino-7-oxononanoate synthase
MANCAAVAAFVGKGDLILSDKLNHASIIDAARACGARLRTYRHCDTGRLEQLLDRHRHSYRRCLIVTDSLFSMDGDLAPLGKLVALKRRFDALLLIDEAHATGVLGDGGRGVAELLAVEDGIDATVGTLSKAIGCLGGFIAGPRVLIDLIRNTARSFIYTTALPASICAAADSAIDIIRDQPERRQRVLELAGNLRSRLQEAGFATGNSHSQIIPILVGSSRDALEVARCLLQRGFLVPAIRPPTVPRGTSRLRVSLSAGHTTEEILGLVDLLGEVRKERGITF